MDNISSIKNPKKTPRERFSHLDDQEFLKVCKKRRSEAKRQITSDLNKLEWKGKYKNRVISNPKVYQDRIERNKRLEILWDDEVKETEFKANIMKQIKGVYVSNYENSTIEETLIISKYVLEIVNWEDYEDWKYTYTINCYENVEDYENGDDYSWGALVFDSNTETWTEEEIQAKYEYITDFIYLKN